MKKSYHSTRLPEQAPMMALTRFGALIGAAAAAWSLASVIDADMLFTLSSRRGDTRSTLMRVRRDWLDGLSGLTKRRELVRGRVY
jgi:hypothetical protein